jgi:4-amino-4-deoxy-L-arabinose transferase-like glycosyltransferase
MICDLGPATIKRHWAIGLILIVFIALGVAYSLVTPIFEAPDEINHYFFVKHLADGKGLPVQGLESRGLWEQEGSQPPLYYLMGALATFWVDTSDAETLLWYNPQANMGTPLDPGNKNVIVHTEREDFPFQGTALAVHLVRLLSVLLGAGTVLITYLIALEIFPQRRDLALGAAAINAFVPQFLFISAAVNNDNLVTFLSSLALLLLIRNTEYGIHGLFVLRIAYSVLLGFVLGLACLSKLTGLGLLILTAIVLVVESCRRRSPKLLVRGVIALAVAMAVAGWWYARNWVLYRDPTGLNMMLAVVGRRSLSPNPLSLWGEFRGLRMSFWALFGWFSILVSPIAYALLDILSLLALVGLVIWVVRQWRGLFAPNYDNKCKGFNEFALRAVGILFLWVTLVLLGLARWALTTLGAQGRLLFPAISAISILLMLGLSQLVPGKYTKTLASVISLAMLVFAALCPFLYIGPAYAKPPLLSVNEIPSDVARLSVDFGGKVQLLGYQLDRKEVKPGQTLGITLYWQGLAKMEENYYLFIHLLGRSGQLVGSEDTYHGWGSYPTSLWRPGEVIADTYQLPINKDALTPSLVRVDVGLYDPSTGHPIGNSVLIGQLKMVPKERQKYAIDNRLQFKLDNKVALIGYKVDKTNLRPGEEVRLTLYWQAVGEMNTDYTVFTHLIDEESNIWGQMDSQPLQGDYPTSFWDIGEVIEDEYSLSIHDDTPAGLYLLEVGMYELATGQRLPVLGKNGEMTGDRILLPLTITVKRNP